MENMNRLMPTQIPASAKPTPVSRFIEIRTCAHVASANKHAPTKGITRYPAKYLAESFALPGYSAIHAADIASTPIAIDGVAGAPDVSSVFAPQRVFNIYHHLADGTLPPDLWDESTELAVMVYLAVRYPAKVALAQLETAVMDYNRVNLSLRLPLLSFDAQRVGHRLGTVSHYVSSLRTTMHIGAIYRMLHSNSGLIFDADAIATAA
jgi:hypothetical protein